MPLMTSAGDAVASADADAPEVVVAEAVIGGDQSRRGRVRLTCATRHDGHKHDDNETRDATE